MIVGTDEKVVVKRTKQKRGRAEIHSNEEEEEESDISESESDLIGRKRKYTSDQWIDERFNNSSSTSSSTSSSSMSNVSTFQTPPPPPTPQPTPTPTPTPVVFNEAQILSMTQEDRQRYVDIAKIRLLLNLGEKAKLK